MLTIQGKECGTTGLPPVIRADDSLVLFDNLVGLKSDDSREWSNDVSREASLKCGAVQ